MIHPIPPGTRDVLPDEMRELRRLNRRLIEVFEAAGYGEVSTPAIEYDEVISRGERPQSASPYRFFDENGDLLALRSDMTVPIARLVATRFADAPKPLRLCYLASASRAVLPQRGEMREFVQAGIELIGAPGADGVAEVIGVLEAALDAAGLDRAVIGLGDADLYRNLLEEFGVEGEARDTVLGRLATHDLVGLEAELSEAGIGAAATEACVALSQLRGGAEVLERAREIGGDAIERTTTRLQRTYEKLVERGTASFSGPSERAPPPATPAIRSPPSRRAATPPPSGRRGRAPDRGRSPPRAGRGRIWRGSRRSGRRRRGRTGRRARRL